MFVRGRKTLLIGQKNKNKTKEIEKSVLKYTNPSVFDSTKSVSSFYFCKRVVLFIFA